MSNQEEEEKMNKFLSDFASSVKKADEEIYMKKKNYEKKTKNNYDDYNKISKILKLIPFI